VIRRSILALSAAVALVALSACSTFNRNDSVATVGGDALSRTELAQLLNNPLVQDDFGTGPVTDSQATVGDQADTVIGVWVVLAALRRSGTVDISGADQRAALTAQYTTDFTSAPATVQQLLTEYGAFHEQFEAGTLDQAKLLAAVQATSVHVDSRYGYWDGATASVQPFGTAT
jgi:hypothetical protein